MKRGSITYFILRSVLAALPLVALVALYVVKDPFGVVKPYKPLQLADGVPHLSYNMGYVTVENYKLNNPSRHYDSFIFGSSMSQNYRVEFWRKYLPANASPLHFDASFESIEGILDKMRYLNSQGTEIKNAIIVIEENMFARTPHDEDLLYARHPATTSPTKWPEFHYTFFKAYKNKLDVVKYLVWPARYEKELLDKRILSAKAPLRNEIYNEELWPGMDTVIAKNPDEFFTAERLKANDINPIAEIEAPNLSQRNIVLLKEMAKLLKKNGTDFVIIIPPRYKRRVAHELDLLTMREIFGEGRVFDFTRCTAISLNPRCFYDQPAHPIPQVCEKILDSVYTTKKRAFFLPKR